LRVFTQYGVKCIFIKYLADKWLKSIAPRLNVDGIASTMGNRWIKGAKEFRLAR